MGELGLLLPHECPKLMDPACPGPCPSDPRRLDHAERRVGRDHPLQPEARVPQEPPVLCLCALPPPEQDQYVEVHRLRRARPVVRRNYHLDQQQRAPPVERVVAVAQQPRRPLVVPVVDDLLEQVQVRPFRHRRKEVAAHQLAALREPLVRDRLPGRRDDVGQIEEDSPRRRIGPQDRGQEDPVRTPDVRHGPHRGEIVDPYQLARRQGRQVAHRRVEEAGLPGVLGVPVEQLHPERLARHGPAGADGPVQPPPGQPVPRCRLDDREVAHGAGCVGAQRLAEGGQLEGTRGDLGEDADAREQPQHPVEGRRIRADATGERGAGARAVANVIGDPELSDDADGLAGLVARDEAHHRDGRGNVVRSSCSYVVLLCLPAFDRAGNVVPHPPSPHETDSYAREARKGRVSGLTVRHECTLWRWSMGRPGRVPAIGGRRSAVP